MGISDKIEEIRAKPEHVRIRYVWGAVFVVMIIILVIWILSVREGFKNINVSSPEKVLPVEKKNSSLFNNPEVTETAPDTDKLNER